MAKKSGSTVAKKDEIEVIVKSKGKVAKSKTTAEGIATANKALQDAVKDMGKKKVAPKTVNGKVISKTVKKEAPKKASSKKAVKVEELKPEAPAKVPPYTVTIVKSGKIFHVNSRDKALNIACQTSLKSGKTLKQLPLSRFVKEIIANNEVNIPLENPIAHISHIA